jgi:hypothetical protein
MCGLKGTSPCLGAAKCAGWKGRLGCIDLEGGGMKRGNEGVVLLPG